MKRPKSPEKNRGEVLSGKGDDPKAALQKNGEYLRGILDSFPDLVLVHRDGIILYVNPAMLDTLGRRLDDLLQKPIRDFIPPEYQTRVAAAIRERTETGRNLPYEIELFTHDGRRRAVLIRGSVIEFDGSPAFLNVLTDITDRVKAEEALRQSEEKYRLLADNATDVLWVIDLATRKFTYFSPAVKKMRGYTPEEAVQIPLEKTFTPEAFTRAMAVLKETLELDKKRLVEHGRVGTYEFQEYCKDGSVISTETRMKFIRNADGVPISIQGVTQDITERKRAEEALQESNRRLTTLIASLQGMVYRCRNEPGWPMEYASDGCTPLTGYTPDEFVKKKSVTLAEIIHPEDRQLVWDDVQEAVAEQRPYQLKYRIISRDGRNHWVWEFGCGVFSEEGALVALEGYIADVTAEHDAEEQLKESESRYSALFTNNNSISLLIDPDTGRIVDANDAATRYYGYSRDQLIAMGIYDLNHLPKDLVVRNLRRAKNEKEKHFFSTHYRADGEKRYVEVYSGPIMVQGKPHFYSIIHDITDRKKAETELQKSQYLLSEAMEMAHMADWEMDGPTGVFTFNDRFYALYGTTAEREGGYQMPAEVYAREFVHPDDQHMVGDEIVKALSTSESGYFSLREHRIIRRDGEVRWIIVRIRVNKDAEGRTIKTHGANQDITNRKQAEEAIRESENKFASVFHSSPAELVLLSINDGTFVDANEAFIRNTGYSRDEVIGKAPESLGMFVEGDVYEKIATTLQDQQSITGMEVRFRTKNGDIKTGLYSASTLFMGGNPYVLSSIEDITERKKMEEDLREARQFFLDIISFLPDPTFAIDNDGKVIAWNRALEQLSGVAGGDIIGKGDHEYSVWIYGKRRPVLIDLVLNPERDTARLDYTDIRWEGRVVTAQAIFTRTSTGQKIPLLAVASPLLDTDGRITGAIESMRDISRLKEAEAKLARFNANLEKIVRKRTQELQEEVVQRQQAEKNVQAALDYTRSVIEANPDLMVVLDNKGTVLDINSAGEMLTGIPVNQLIGKPYLGFLEDDGTLQSNFTRLITNEISENFIQVRRVDGHLTPLSVHATVVHGNDNTGDRIIVAAHDITRQKADEAAIQGSLDEKVILLREIHHRVKNNLQIIISLTNLQMRKSTDPSVKLIMAETQNRVRAMSLVHEKLYRSDTLSQIDFAEYTRFLATQLFSFYTIDTRRVKLEVTLKKTMVDINTAVPLGLIMNELVSNALKHAFPDGRNGTLAISGGIDENDQIILIIKDDGVGMSAGIDWQNTGTLGMRLITSLVDQVGGTITMESDKGTIFIVRVPKRSEREEMVG